MLTFSSIESSVPFLIKFTIDRLSMQEPGTLPLLAGIAFGLSLLRGIVGLMNRTSGAMKMYNVAGLFMSLGLLALFFGLLNTALKDKEVPSAVRVAKNLRPSFSY